MTTFCKLFTNIIWFMFFTDILRFTVNMIHENYCFGSQIFRELMVYIVWIAGIIAITYLIWRSYVIQQFNYQISRPKVR